MRRFLLIAAKSFLALLSLVGVGLLASAAYFVWYTEYGLGVPTEEQIAAVAATGPACTTDWRGTYVPLAKIPALLQKTTILVGQPDFYERLPNPLIEFGRFATLNLIDLHHVQPIWPRPSNITGSVTSCLMSSLAPNLRGPGLDWHLGNIVMTNRVARTLSRDRTLEIYLNETYFGRDSYGVANASMAYFGESLDRLSIDEIALLVVLPKMPSVLDRNEERAKERRNYIIERMLQAGLISEADAATARDHPLVFREKGATKPPGQ